MKEKRKYRRQTVNLAEGCGRIRMADSDEWIAVRVFDQSVQGFGLMFQTDGFKVGDKVILEVNGVESDCEIRNLVVLGNSAFRMGVSIDGLENCHHQSEFQLANLRRTEQVATAGMF